MKPGRLESMDRVFGRSNNPAIRTLANQEDLDADYSNGIPVAKTKGTGDIVYIDFHNTTKVGLFGPSGSGKTIFGKAMVSRLSETGRVIYNGGDVKNDFQVLDKYGGVSKKLIDKMGLMANEEPTEIPKKLFVPKPVLEAWGKNPSYVTPFTLGFQDISETDFKFLVGEGDLTTAQDAVLSNVLNEISIKETSFDELRTLVEQKSESVQVEKSLRSKLNGLESNMVISNRYREDPVKFLDEGYAVALGLQGFSNFTNGGMYKLQFYVSVVFRNLMNRVMKGDIDADLVGLWPEFHRMAPSGESSLLKQQVEEFFNMKQRQMDMPIVLDSQSPGQIPNPNIKSSQYNFLGKLTHVFLGCDRNGRELGEKDWKTVLKSMNMLNRSNVDEWRSRMASLEPFDFLYVNPGKHDRPRDCPVVRSLAPLVSHPD
ncbi:MAG: hypothetical protein ABEJ56_05760 [Candidatus Nanohaloarchaea archaeon]